MDYTLNDFFMHCKSSLENSDKDLDWENHVRYNHLFPCVSHMRKGEYEKDFDHG